MKSFLRYNSRHHWFMSRDRGLLLNPTSYSTSEEAWSAHEPLWMFRLRQRWFAFAGYHRCPERGSNPLGQSPAFDGHKPNPDTWDVGPDGNRTCSFCGSIHFDDLMKVARKVPDDARYALDGTTKGYKIYVRQPGVMNASQGAIKFYSWHAPKEPSADDELAFSTAMKLSHDRVMERFKPKAA